MTSFGAKIISEGKFMPTFKVQGQIYHLIGSVLPPHDQSNKFLQIYFISDTREQIDVRKNNFSDLDRSLIGSLQLLLHQHHVHVQNLKTALDSLPNDEIENYNLVIKGDIRPVGAHPGRYNEPSVNEVAVLMVGEPSDRRDIVLQTRSNQVQKIIETHRAYDSLQYPLMFCRGEDGYHFSINQFDPVRRRETNKKVSALDFYSFRIMIRKNEYNHIHLFQRLFNQFLVDVYAKIESERLLFIRLNQRKLRAEQYIHLQDTMRRNENPDNLGTLVILPSSFTGGPRYMHARTQDAFCYVRKYGRPNLFITITTNPKWNEIKNNLYQNQEPHDRHDLVARVFHLKLKNLMSLLIKGKIFGSSRCYVYSVEWQKRELPHAHILLWLEETIRADRIDSIIRAEFPDPNEDSSLFEIVKRHMVHGPCGVLNPNAPCMKEIRCLKKYPRPFVDETQTGEDGYPTYRRRSPEKGGYIARIKCGRVFYDVDNRWVVPYCPVLSRTFETHINIELCSSVKSIKYILKYVNKGSDQATFGFKNENNEVDVYQSGRCISSSEAVCRILRFPIHERYPPVIPLDVHLENGQRIYFNTENVRERIENPKNTTLLSFFTLCQKDVFAKSLLYFEVPSFFTFNKSSGVFKRRKVGLPMDGNPGVKRDATIGRIYTIHPSNSECYYLRMLLHIVRGPTSFEHLRTVNGIVHPTFQSACKAHGLLEGDTHWEDILREASVLGSAQKLRELFSVLLLFCNLSDPLDIWNKFKDDMTEDFLHHARRSIPTADYRNSPYLYDKCLSELQSNLKTIGGGGLEEYNLPIPQENNTSENFDLLRETSYNCEELKSFVETNESKLNVDQRSVYRTIIDNINSGNEGVFFLDAPGGTGKTYLINLILAKLRCEGKVALAVASSGIAATLLPGGRTAHSMFKIPVDISRQETPMCSLSRNSNIAAVIRKTSLIVWDENTMANKKSIEALNRTLIGIRKCNVIMGGITTLFSGDFRQTLPVVAGGTPADEINACFKRSSLWANIIHLSLTENMRVQQGVNQNSLEFSRILLEIGNGTIETDCNELITIPSELAVTVDSLQLLIDHVFPDISDLLSRDCEWLCERAILTPKNYKAAEVNHYILSLFPGEERTYSSINTVLDQDEAVHNPVEYLNSISAPGLPAHEITLKIGSPIILMRNLQAPKLCNGTRLRIRRLFTYVIEADILTGCGKGESVFIPRIPIIPSDYPFQFKRLQFPVRVCFAMTINKSQGQTLSVWLV